MIPSVFLGIAVLALQPADGPWNHKVHFATSADGLAFVEIAEPVMERAGVPDIIELVSDLPGAKEGKGQLVIFCVDAGTTRAPGQEQISRLVSADGGATWSGARPIEISGKPGDDEGWNAGGVPVDPAVIQLPDGRIRLYFLLMEPGTSPPWVPEPILPRPENPEIPPPDQPREPGLPPHRPVPRQPSPGEPRPFPGESTHRILSAVADDGVHFQLEPGERLAAPGVTDPEVVQAGGEWLMFLSRGEETLLARSSDGLSFAMDESFRLTGGGVPGALVLPDGTVRVYQSSREGITSSVFDPGLGTVKKDAGVRVRGPCADPAVWPKAAGEYVAVVKRFMGDVRPLPGRNPR